MLQRLAMCSTAGRPCLPLTWTLSPAALRLAPDWVRWYYRQVCVCVHASVLTLVVRTVHRCSLHLWPHHDVPPYDLCVGQALTTGQDWFVLPPSGDTYSYPGEMSPQNQARFVAKTEQDAFLSAPRFPPSPDCLRRHVLCAPVRV